MDMGHMSSSDGDACRISMLWNWYTIDACFLTSSWRITNQGMFAASCIGVAALAVLLEGLRRISREYESAIQRQWQAQAIRQVQLRSAMMGKEEQMGEKVSFTFRSTPLQQLFHAILHAATFTLAYIIMLLFMYFNGYIIISIIIGAGLGKYLCDWPSTTIEMEMPSSTDRSRNAAQKGSCCSQPI